MTVRPGTPRKLVILWRIGRSNSRGFAVILKRTDGQIDPDAVVTYARIEHICKLLQPNCSFHFKKIVENINKIESDIHYPVFVKPANTGSSIGISKVKNKLYTISSTYT